MRPFRVFHVIIMGVSGVVILIAGTWLVSSWHNDAGKERKDQQAKAPDKGVGVKGKNGGNEPEKPRVDPGIQADERARSKARRQAVLDLKAEIIKSLTALEHEVVAWETRIPGLLKSVEGKKIAVNPARAEQFAGVIEKDRVSKKRVGDLRVRLDTLTEPVEQAKLTGNLDYSPSDAIVADLREIEKEVKTKLADLGTIRVEIDTLQSDSAFTPPGEKTLEKVIADIEAERARRRAELIAKAKQEEYDRESKRLAAAQVKAEKDLTDARLKLLEARTEAEKLGIDFQIEDAKRKADEAKAAEQKRIEKAKREAKFDAAYPAMKDYLVAFTSPGHKQFNGGWLKMSPTKGPMSCASLKAHLTKSESASFQLARNINFENDRPKGAFPYMSTGGAGCTTENYAIVYRIQDFIAEFGDIMVERKLLAP